MLQNITSANFVQILIYRSLDNNREIFRRLIELQLVNTPICVPMSVSHQLIKIKRNYQRKSMIFFLNPGSQKELVQYSISKYIALMTRVITYSDMTQFSIIAETSPCLSEWGSNNSGGVCMGRNYARDT